MRQSKFSFNTSVDFYDDKKFKAAITRAMRARSIKGGEVVEVKRSYVGFDNRNLKTKKNTYVVSYKVKE